MKLIKNIFFTMLAVTIVSACSEDDIDFSFEELRNEEFDLAVVTDAQQYVEAAFSVTGELENISASITPDGGTEPVGTETISNFTGNSFSRINVQIPFPAPNIAESGLYTISYTIQTSSGEQSGGSYQVNVINNRSPLFCEYSDALPSGANTWVRVYTPTGDQLDEGEVLYLTGSFEGWSGGGSGSIYSFEKIDATCYQIAVSLEDGDEFKVTRGTFDNEAQDFQRENFSNYVYAGESSINFFVYDWKDIDLDLTGIAPPPAPGDNIPSSAIEEGKLTVTVNVNGYDVNEGNYYIVEEGATDTTGAYLMIPYESENKLAVAVPKATGVNYIIIKDSIEAIGTDNIGRVQSATWDGMTNPANFSVASFEGGLTTLYMTGDATDGWSGGGDFPLNATEPGIFVGTFNVNGDSEYLILPSPGDFDNKWGFGGTGDASSGTLLQGGGPNISTEGLTTGTYTVTVDLTVDPPTYSLVQ